MTPEMKHFIHTLAYSIAKPGKDPFWAKPDNIPQDLSEETLNDLKTCYRDLRIFAFDLSTHLAPDNSVLLKLNDKQSENLEKGLRYLDQFFKKLFPESLLSPEVRPEIDKMIGQVYEFIDVLRTGCEIPEYYSLATAEHHQSSSSLAASISTSSISSEISDPGEGSEISGSSSRSSLALSDMTRWSSNSLAEDADQEDDQDADQEDDGKSPEDKDVVFPPTPKPK